MCVLSLDTESEMWLWDCPTIARSLQKTNLVFKTTSASWIGASSSLPQQVDIGHLQLSVCTKVFPLAHMATHLPNVSVIYNIKNGMSDIRRRKTFTTGPMLSFSIP